ncbi:MAG: HAMP domain-containing protein [Candidatus Binatia bacterium]
MTQQSATVENSKFVTSETAKPPRGGLRWKIAYTFSGLILLLGLLVIGIVYHFTNSALQKHVDLRAAAIATNLADAATGLVSRKSNLEIDALVAKYGRLDGVAYAFVQDAKGEILGTSVRPFPTELKDGSPTVAMSRLTSLRGKEVYETRAAMLDGQLGSARVGLWAETVKDDVRSTLLPIMGLIGACVALGVALSIMLASKIVRPILDLKAIADDISRGRLDTAVPIQSNDEIGELGRSLERMRASLRAAMIRLNRE